MKTVQYYSTECKADASCWYFLIVIVGFVCSFFYTMTLFDAIFDLSPWPWLRPVVSFDCTGVILGLHTTVLSLQYSWVFRLYLKCVLLCCEKVYREVLTLPIFFNKELKNGLSVSDSMSHTHTHTCVCFSITVGHKCSISPFNPTHHIHCYAPRHTPINTLKGKKR